ncbi:Cof-type HAD-IIB family hydrolase [Paenibacillus puerhi]|uniref:Cof-type HAD-IIB family hydrolase n=1 Tax=Paenibacillus puerhi TaxID=2692622 RepID=UPI00135776CA|nr:Cof-type HAD-IIB family hydrolase [Paenibacillus puerhi]
MIKLAAFDVDGTLRDRDHLPASTRSAVKRLKESGVIPVLCTGRSEYEIASLREELGMDWAITCNGSHIGYQGKTMFGTPFGKEKVVAWLQEAERSNHALLLYGSEFMYTNRANDPLFLRAREEIGFLEPRLLDLSGGTEALPEFYQSIIFCEELQEGLYTGGNAEEFYIHRWRPWAVDLNPRGMNKAIGLKKLLEHLTIAPEEAAAFGDGLNDMELLAAVGTGIAMGNAIEELKGVARHVTRSLHEDGIAYAVDTWILPG